MWSVCIRICKTVGNGFDQPIGDYRAGGIEGGRILDYDADAEFNIYIGVIMLIMLSRYFVSIFNRQNTAATEDVMKGMNLIF